MRKILTVIFLLISFQISYGQTFGGYSAKASTNGSLNDTIKLCTYQSLSLVSKLVGDSLYTFSGGLPQGFSITPHSGHITDTICGSSTTTNQGNVCWFSLIDSMGNGVTEWRVLHTNYYTYNICRVEWDMKFSDFTEGCIPFNNGSISGAVYMDYNSMSIALDTANAPFWKVGNVTCTGPTYMWSHYVKDVNPNSSIHKLIWRNFTPFSWGLDNIKIFYNTPYDSVKWTCIEDPNLYFNKDTTFIPTWSNTRHYISTIFKGGLYYSDTLVVIISPVLYPSSTGIIGPDSICPGITNATYKVIINNATSYQWSLSNHSIVLNSNSLIDSILSISNIDSVKVHLKTTYNSGILYVTGSNSCSSVKDSILITVKQLIPVKICYIEVDSSTEKYRIHWMPVSLRPDSINIYVLGDSALYKKVGTTTYNSKSYLDLSSTPQSKSSVYRISSVNSCNLESSKSDVHITPKLGITNYIQGFKIDFIWTPYLIKKDNGLFPNSLLSTTSVSSVTLCPSQVYNVHGVDAGGNDSILIGGIPFAGNTSTYYIATYNNPDPKYIYYYVGFDINPCDITKSVYSIRASNFLNKNTLGVNVIERLNINIYPNPVNDQLTIESSYRNVKFVILNSIGQVVYNDVCIFGKFSINLENLKPGMYSIKLENVVFKKFIKR